VRMRQYAAAGVVLVVGVGSHSDLGPISFSTSTGTCSRAGAVKRRELCFVWWLAGVWC